MDYLLSVISDAHISPTDTAWANSGIRGDARYALAQFVDLSIEARVRYAVGLGDLMDRAVNGSLAPAVWSRELYRLEDAGIPFLFIRGNHDNADPPWLASHRNTVHLHKRLFEAGNLRLYGLDFQPTGRLQEELALVPKGTDILVCHQGWSEFMNRPGSFQGSLKEIPNARRVLTGDLHRYEHLRVVANDGHKMHVFSPGATCKQAVNEPDDHVVLLVRPDGEVERRALNSRPILRSDTVATSEQLDTFVGSVAADARRLAVRAASQGMPAEVCKPLVVLHHDRRLTDAFRRVDRALGDRGFLFCTALGDEEEQSRYEEGVTDQGRVTLLSCLEEEVPGESPEDLELKTFLTRLLTAGDVAGEERAFRDEYLAKES